MIRYKLDVLEALKKAGYTTTRLRREHIVAEGTLTKIRAGVVVGVDVLDKLCELLHRQPGSLIEWVPDKAGGENR